MRSTPFRPTVLLLLLVSLGCHDAPTQPLTPLSALNLDGSWTGTLTYEASGDPACPVQENFETTIAMNGGQFGFHVNTRCHGTLVIDGRIVSDLSQANLIVNIEGADEELLATLGGSASDRRIEATAQKNGRHRQGAPVSLLLTR